MSGYLDRLAAFATGRYGPGPAARPVSPMADYPDPMEVIEEVTVPSARPASGPAAMTYPTDGSRSAGAEASQPEISPAPDRPLAGEKVTSPPGASLREPSKERADRPQAQPPGPFPSYAEARTPRFTLPEVADAADDQLQITAAPVLPVTPGLPVKDRPEPPLAMAADDTPLSHEPAAAAPPPVTGLEIGELSITVMPPPFHKPPPTPARRGVAISPSAALRRAGIRRL